MTAGHDKPRAIMDFPTAWAYVRERATKHGTGEHDPRCSFVTENGALLCDCAVLWDEYARREAAFTTGEPQGSPPTSASEGSRRG